MGCREISVWPNGLLWNICITQWVVMKNPYDLMSCYEIFVLPNGLLWNICMTKWVVMKSLYYPMGCYEKSIWPNELLWNSYPSVWPNELDYLIAAAKWKQVFGSKAHLCRAHLACWFQCSFRIQTLFCFSINRSARVYRDTCWCPNCESNSCHTLKKEIMRW